LENFFLGQSYALSDYYTRYIMAQQQWTLEKLLQELPCMSLLLSWYIDLIRFLDISRHGGGASAAH
jgi:hypothetical protein